jgi:hypothetical protein
MTTRLVIARAVVVLSLAVGAASVTGCRPPKEQLYARPALVGETVYVRVTDAHVRGERVFVKTWMQNRTDDPVVIDRDALSLRLPDGRVLPRSSGRTTRHKPYVLGPGEGRDVFVDFRARGEYLGDLSHAFLVVDGVLVGDDPKPRTLGEISLATSPSRASAPQAKESPASEGAGEPEAEEPAEEESDEPQAEQEQGEDWEIGSQ